MHTLSTKQNSVLSITKPAKDVIEQQGNDAVMTHDDSRGSHSIFMMEIWPKETLWNSL